MKDASEKKLAERILALTDALPDIPVRMRNSYHETIAALCWELVYHRLAQGAVREHWLQAARRHMERVLDPLAAKPVLPAAPSRPDGDSWLLYGRILLDSGDKSRRHR